MPVRLPFKKGSLVILTYLIVVVVVVYRHLSSNLINSLSEEIFREPNSLKYLYAFLEIHQLTL